MGGRGSGKNDAKRYGAYLTDEGLKNQQKYYDLLISERQRDLEDPYLNPISRRVYEDDIGQFNRRKEMLARKFEEARELLGDKGRPMSIEDAMDGVNPFWTPYSMEWHNNCQRCVLVYELRRRGYRVSTTRFEGWDEKSLNWKNAFKGMRFEKAGSRNREAVINNLYNKMEQWGEGSRAIIRVEWTSGGSHVFNAEFKNGRLILVEGQNGQYADWARYERQMKPTKTSIARVDNLDPTENIVGLMRKFKR